MADEPVSTLAGKSVVVTRPAHQADALCKLISAKGGTPLRFPVLEIVEPQNPLDFAHVKSLLSSAQLVIFISPNAVEYGTKAIDVVGGLPDSIKVAAIGQGTARKLAAWGRTADIFPSNKFDSEALLAMEELQSVSGQRVVIFRGEGGREHLANTLRERGATVDYIECYRRIPPRVDTAELSFYLDKESVNAVVVTSNEGLQNLYDMLSPHDQTLLLNVQLFAVSERTKDLAVSLGFVKPAIIVNQASDQGIVETLEQWA